MNIVLAIIIGFLFGYALYFVGASSSKNLISMLRLEDLSLMKIILFGIGFASVLLSIFGLLGIINLDHLSVKTTHLGVVIGGLLFGVGFSTIGTCPGTCVTASSSGGGKKALSAIIGGLVGAWLFSMSYGMWENLGLFDTMNLGSITLFAITPEFPAVFNIGFSGLLAVGIVFMLIAYILPLGRHATNDT